MKKIIAYTAVLAALMAVSCSRMEEKDLVDFQSSVITLSLNTTEMVATRSAIPDVESVVSQFDWFFYPDATGTSAPVYHGHATVSESTMSFSGPNTPDDLGIDDKGYHIGFDVENTYKDLKGDYYVYVIANYADIDHNASDLTLATLLAKTMETNWDEKSKGYTAINDFVMDSYSGNDEATYPQLVPLSAAIDEDKDGKANLAVNLQRVAAKISFTLNIAKEIVDDPVTGTKWRPLTKSVNYTAYMVNALTYATVQGNAIDAESDNAVAHHLSYATSHVKTEKTATDETYVWEVDPFYTYPVSFDPASNNAPYFKLALPWENVDSNGHLTSKGSTLFYYKAYLRDKDGNALTSYDRNKHYIVTLNVDVLGGTPEDYATLDTYYYVANWQSPADGTYDGYFAPRYLDIARPEYYLYGDNSTTIAVTSSHTISARVLSASQRTIAGANKTVTIPSNAVTANGKASFTLNYNLNTAITSRNMDITPITWNVRISHADDASVYKDVIIYQYPSIYGEQRRTGPDNPTNTTDARYTFLNGTRYNYNTDRSIVVQSNTPGVNLGSITGGDPTSRDKLIFTVSTLASLLGETAYTKNGTAVKFSDVTIGDPRSKISFPITRQNVSWNRTDLGEAPNYIDNYLVADPAKSTVVAPRFMFPAGRLGSNRANNVFANGGSWRAAAERCAAYQEGGYPAGRWRLPTEAEVAFCRQLQQYGYIDGLFFDGNAYWTASGTYFQNGVASTPGNNTLASVRCVYDLWYWGEEPYNNDKQPIALEDVEWVNPATANTPANTWLGFMTE